MSQVKKEKTTRVKKEPPVAPPVPPEIKGELCPYSDRFIITDQREFNKLEEYAKAVKKPANNQRTLFSAENVRLTYKNRNGHETTLVKSLLIAPETDSMDLFTVLVDPPSPPPGWSRMY